MFANSLKMILLLVAVCCRPVCGQESQTLLVDKMDKADSWLSAGAGKCIVDQDGNRAYLCFDVNKSNSVQYQGISKKFENLDFSKYDVMTFWVKASKPCGSLHILIRNADALSRDVSASSLIDANILPDKWYFILWPYKTHPGWFNPLSSQIELTSVGFIQFYCDKTKIADGNISVCVADVRLLTYQQIGKEIADDPAKRHGNEKYYYAVLEKPLPDMMPNYMNARLKNFSQKLGPVPRDTNEWQVLRDRIKKKLCNSLNFTPASRPIPRATIKGKIENKDYSVEKFLIQTRQGIYMPCFLYVPKGKPLPAAAVLVLNGHGEAGYWGGQERCIPLVLHGYVVMNVDNFNAGERSDVSPLVSESDDSLTTAAFSVAGPSLAGMMLHDHVCALDYLCSRPEVDVNHIGVTGASGGATYGLALAIADDRIAAVVPVCGNLPAYSTHLFGGPCQNLPGIYEVADNDLLYAAIAPRPMMHIYATGDTVYNLEQLRNFEKITDSIYRSYGDAGRHKVLLIEGPHSYNLAMREAMAGFFGRWLRNSGDGSPVPEPKYERIDPALLRFFPDGKRPSDWLTSDAYLLKTASQAAKAQGDPPGTTGEVSAWQARKRDAIYKIIGLVRSNAKANFKIMGSVARQDAIIEKVIINSEPGITIPFVVVQRPNGKAKRPAFIMAHPNGKAKIMTSQLARKLVDANIIVAAVDVRDTGETWYPYEAETSYVNICDSYIHYSALSLGSTAIGMWSRDLSSVCDYLMMRNDVDTGRIYIYGFKQLGLATLVTAALDSRIKGAYVENTSPTYISERGYGRGYIYKGDNSNLGGLGYISADIPGFMSQVGDITHLIAVIAPRPVGIIDPLWADGSKMTYEELRNACRWPAQVYNRMQKPGALQLFDELNADTIIDRVSTKD